MGTIRLEWQRRLASSKRIRIAVLVAVSLLTFSFALFLWWFFGAWLVLPFAGVEVVCLAAAFWWVEQSGSDYDCVEVGATSVTVVSVRMRRVRRTVLKRDWLSAELGGEGAGEKRSVKLRQAGRTVAMLEFLPMPEQHRALRDLRVALATRL